MATKKETNDLREIMRLMRRWVFDLAYVLMNDECMGRSEAMKQAHLTRELLEALGRGEVRFVYEKQDGTLREARGTLCQRLMPQQEADAVERQARREPDYNRLDYAYWDWDKRAFRAFRADKVVRICAVSIPNYREPKHSDKIV